MAEWYELSCSVRTSRLPTSADLSGAIKSVFESSAMLNDLNVEKIDKRESGDVSVVRIPSYLAVCKLCVWKMKYARRAEAERFSRMHLEQRHPEAVKCESEPNTATT